MINEAIFSTGAVTVGKFRCSAAHPQFSNTGPIRDFCVVFPRTSVWICHRDDTPFVADPNVAPLYNQGQEYTRERLATEGDRCDWFSVAPDVLRDLVRAVDPRAADSPDRIFRFSRGPCDRRVYAAQRAVYKHVSSTARPDPLFIEEAVVNFVGRVVEDTYRQEMGTAALRTRGVQHETVEAVRSILSVRFAQRITLAQISDAVGVSMFHLARIFARVTGSTIHAYQQQLRVRAALEQVMDSTDDLLQIAINLGYSSHSHFTTEFRRTFGDTPSALRQPRRTH